MGEETNHKTVKLIGTHPGVFHLDDAASTFLIRTAIPEFTDAKVCRTGDPKQLSKCEIVYDVGGKYDHEKKLYDHHHRGFNEVFNERWSVVKLSSFGLLYRHYGRDMISAIATRPIFDTEMELVYNKFYDSFVVTVDAIDNGVPRYPSDVGEPLYIDETTLATRVALMNPAWNCTRGPGEHMELFEGAVKLAGEEITDHVRRLIDIWLPSRSVVERAFKLRNTHDSCGRIMVLDQACPWKSILHDLETSDSEILYVITPDCAKQRWSAQAVEKHPGTFATRLPFPEPWRGLTGSDLAKVCGVKGAAFVHASGFLAVNWSLEGVVEMCHQSIAYHYS